MSRNFKVTTCGHAELMDSINRDLGVIASQKDRVGRGHK